MLQTYIVSLRLHVLTSHCGPRKLSHLYTVFLLGFSDILFKMCEFSRIAMTRVIFGTGFGKFLV